MPEKLYAVAARIRIRRVLRSAAYTGAPIPLVQLLADIRHLCDDAGLSFGALDGLAHDCYLNERRLDAAIVAEHPGAYKDHR